MSPTGFAEFVARHVAPSAPEGTILGVAMHYDGEVDEDSAADLALSLRENGLFLSMLSPGAHGRFAYGSLGSPDPLERASALDFFRRALDLLQGPLAPAHHPERPAVFDIWVGSLGYEIPTVIVSDMLRWADDAIADLLARSLAGGAGVRMGVEPKPSEGHPALLYQGSAEVLALRGRLRASGLDVSAFGLVNEFGHTQMSGMELVQDYAAALLDGAVVHVHANSQGADGARLGGAGKYDIDYGVGPDAATLAVAQLLSDSGYDGWVEHDIQPRPYDDVRGAVGRIIRSICSWEAVMRVAESGALSRDRLLRVASARRTMDIEDMVRDAMSEAHRLSKELFRQGSGDA